jgi:hypothetical protein
MKSHNLTAVKSFITLANGVKVINNLGLTDGVENNCRVRSFGWSNVYKKRSEPTQVEHAKVLLLGAAFLSRLD